MNARLALGACLLAGLTHTAAAAPDQTQTLQPFEASYAWSWHSATVAISTLKLEHREGDRWTYSSSGEPRGIGYLYPLHPELVSELLVTDQGVQPQRFKASAGSASRNA